MAETALPSDSFPFSIHDAIRWRSADVAALLHVLRTLLIKKVRMPESEGAERIWIYLSYEELADQLPWLMVDEIQKITDRLKKTHYLAVEPFGRNTDKYSNIYKFSLNEPPFHTNPQMDMEV